MQKIRSGVIEYMSLQITLFDDLSRPNCGKIYFEWIRDNSSYSISSTTCCSVLIQYMEQITKTYRLKNIRKAKHDKLIRQGAGGSQDSIP